MRVLRAELNNPPLWTNVGPSNPLIKETPCAEPEWLLIMRLESHEPNENEFGKCNGRSILSTSLTIVQQKSVGMRVIATGIGPFGGEEGGGKGGSTPCNGEEGGGDGDGGEGGSGDGGSGGDGEGSDIVPGSIGIGTSYAIGRGGGGGGGHGGGGSGGNEGGDEGGGEGGTAILKSSLAVMIEEAAIPG